ncbi:MAG: spore maturation protein A [Clostridia bacterium]|nr:spore maturation protein A [Clostridia bacterium]
MLMSRILAALILISLVLGALTGRMPQVSQATVSGAEEAVRLLLRIGGTLCFWNGLMEVMLQSGLANRVARLLSPLIRLLFGSYAEDEEARAAIAQNMAANLLGLGSAATPSGLRAAKRLKDLAHRRNEAPHGVFLLIVLNTASLQLLPTTVAAVRAGLGSAQPYDILPAVWLSSALSVTVGMIAARLMRGGGRL